MSAARIAPVAGVYNGRLYVFGGYTAFSGVYAVTPTASAESYDPGSNAWSAVAPMPAPEAFSDGVGVINGKLYLVGGVNFPQALRIFDPATNAWSAGPDRPVGSQCGSVAAIGSLLYVLSGYSGGSSNSFFSYNPSNGTWTQLPGSPNFHCFAASGVINGKFYVAGGEDGVFARYVNIYDPASNAWTTGSPIPVSTVWEHMSSAVVNGKLYVMGGAVVQCLVLPNCITSEAIAYDPTTDKWTTIIPVVNAGGPYAGGAGNPIAFGGQSSDVLSTAPTARQLAAAGAIDGSIFVAGGADVTNTMALGTLEAFTPPGLATLSFNWDFGDGSVGQGANPTHVYTSPGTYTVALTVATAAGRSGTASATVTVTGNRPPVANAGGPYTGTEGSGVAFDATHSFDPDGDALTYTWTFGDGATATGPTPTHVFPDNGQYIVTVTADDGRGGITSSGTIATISNVAPAIGAIGAPAGPVQIATTAAVSTTFSDPGVLDTHSATVAWGDGTSSSGSVTESNGSGTTSASHVYTSPGVYTLSVSVIDKDGGATSTTYQYVVVYDPSGGFVTGGGWINSPPGAYVTNAAVSGKATFGFVAKYQHGADAPTGNTQFNFNAAGLSFNSTNYEWLVVAGARAQFKGTGTINGGGNYGFMLTAIDGAINGGGGTDKLRLKIWDVASGSVVYDNQVGASDSDNPLTVLGGGSIIIHN